MYFSYNIPQTTKYVQRSVKRELFTKTSATHKEIPSFYKLKGRNLPK